MKRSLALFLTFVAVLWAPTLSAQEKPTIQPTGPTITKLDRLEAPPGSALNIFGQNFGKDPKLVKVTLGNKKCLVTMVTDTQLMVVTSLDSAVGQTEVIVEVKGQKSNKQPFTVLDPESVSKDYWKKRTKVAEDNQREDSELKRSQFLRITKLEFKDLGSQSGSESGSKFVIAVAGEAPKMPDEFRVNMIFSFEKQYIDAFFTKVKNGRFACEFGPYKKDLFPGRYKVEAAFELRRQSLRIRRAWGEKIGKKELKNYVALEAKKYFQIGDANTLSALSTEYCTKYKEVYTKLRKEFEDFQQNYASATRSAFVKNDKGKKQVDEAAWSQWLKTQRFIRNSNDFEKIKKRTQFMKGLYLDVGKWEDYCLDFVARLKTHYAKVESFEGKFLTFAFEKAGKFLKSNISVLFDLQVRRTMFFYRFYKIKMPDKVRVVLGSAGFQNVPFSSVGRFLSTERRFLKFIDSVEQKIQPQENPEKKDS